jgi:membrane-bound inhibitor of C-type lysozyme
LAKRRDMLGCYVFWSKNPSATTVIVQ